MDEMIKKDCMEYMDKIDLSPLKNRKVCITGANGLIGTYLIYMLHLANICRNADIDIIAISRHPPAEKLRDVFSFGYEFHSMDLSKAGIYDFPFQADYIIHGATYAQPGKFLKNYLETIRLNTWAVEVLLEKAKRDDATFLFLSSSEVYGNPGAENIPTPESYPGLCSPVNARAIYSESKRLGETLCYAYRNYESVDAKIARISMSYGPGTGMDDERVLSQFIRQALSEGRIRMIDDGSKTRTFCYIADCVLMLLYVLIYGRGFVYNVGGSDRITVKELAEEICRITGSVLESAGTQVASNRDIKVSPDIVELDTRKIRSEFSLPPFKPLREGLASTIRWNMLQAQARQSS
jgi:UDP-glucuronate decarboxylase